MALESCSTSPAERTTSSAARFWSTRAACLVPGIGTMSVPCASSHAKATWPGVQPLATAVAFGNVRGLLHGAGQQAAAERRVGHERNAQGARRLQRLLGVAAIEQRI